MAVLSHATSVPGARERFEGMEADSDLDSGSGRWAGLVDRGSDVVGLSPVTSSDADRPGEERIPVSEVLPGMLLHPLEDGSTPVEAFVLVKLLDADGEVSWAYRTTNRLNREELLGALVVHVAVLTEELRREWDEDDEG